MIGIKDKSALWRVIIFTIVWIAFWILSALQMGDVEAGYWFFGINAYPILLGLLIFIERLPRYKEASKRNQWYIYIYIVLVSLILSPIWVGLTLWVGVRIAKFIATF